ncbi:MAG: methyltransferase domain-containing protein [Acidimicrobiales bacterium]
MVADAARLQGGVRADFVRRMVGYRLPVGSLVADVSCHPDSCLQSFTDDYATLAVTTAATLAVRAPVATLVLRAGPAHLPLADATVDCVLLLDVVARPHGGHGPLTEARRVLRPGGLAVLSASVGAPTSGVAGTGPGTRRQAGARLVAMLGDLGLVPEQVHHLQSLLHPSSLVTRVRSGSRARSGRRSQDHAEPWLCRTMAAVNRLDQAKLARLRGPKTSAVIALGRKP